MTLVCFITSTRTFSRLDNLSEIAPSIMLKVNSKKTKVMKKNATVNTPVNIDGAPLEDVQEFVYLGSKMTADGDCDVEVNVRISKANQAFAMLKSVWRSTNLSLHTKIRIYKGNVLSVLLNGSQCWKTTVAIKRKLEVFQNKCLRRILRVFWPENISNDDIRDRTERSLCKSQSRRRWLGHVCRMPDDSLPRTALK